MQDLKNDQVLTFHEGAASEAQIAEIHRQHKISQERLDDVMTLLRGWIWETDADHRFSYFSDSVKSVVGRSPEWHYGKTRADITNMDKDSPAWQDHLACLRQKKPFPPIIIHRKEGEVETWMKTVGLPRFDEENNFIGYRGFAIEISHERRLEAEKDEIQRKLLELATRMDVVVSNLPIGLAAFDVTLNVTIVNDRFCQIFGTSRSVVKPGLDLSQVCEISQDFNELVGDRMKTLPAGSQGFRAERRLSSGRVVEIVGFPMSTNGIVMLAIDVTERYESEKNLREIAHRDSLTGLFNRAYFQEALQKLVSEAHYETKFAVHMFDLDRFKLINDTLGHPMGDKLLRQVGERLRRSVLRADDIVARMGGDEFAIVQIGAERPEQAAAVASRIVKALSEPFSIDGHEICISASIGIAFCPSDALDSDQLLKAADTALYFTKDNGRNSFSFFNGAMVEALNARRELEAQMRRAIHAKEFKLNFQPIFCLRTNELRGFEALLRWRLPDGRVVPPSEFIPVAEETGLIVGIGRFVLLEACRFVCNWPEGISISVNLSPVQFANRDMVEVVRTVLEETGLSPGRLVLEVTESVLLRDTESIRAQLVGIKNAGVKLSMDDFGVGYASISYLCQFPFDKVKIDRSFVSAISRDNPSSLAVVKAIVDLARALGKSTIAEGIETEEQYILLSGLDCQMGQGYLMGRPMTAEAAFANLIVT